MNFNFLKNKSILVTGGTGSIGSALVYRLIKTDCKVIRIMSNDENGLYELSRELNLSSFAFDNFSKDMKKNKVRFILGDVRDFTRCKEVSENIDIVIHAAALKHVSIVEYNQREGYQTNYIGTKNMMRASIKNKVSKFLLISTDKVVSPSSHMGKTKAMAERLITNKKNYSLTKISIIRFGNVLGSRGSVVPGFIKLLENKKNLIVTDKKMARFVMSINDAVSSILRSISLMRGDEIFISKSMKCFKIFDLAQALIKYFQKLNKKKNKIYISKKYTGEKFEEELYSLKEIPFISIKNNLFVISKNKTKNNKKTMELLIKHRASNYNFLKQSQIINFLVKSKILKSN